jgi:hypothetical protein
VHFALPDLNVIFSVVLFSSFKGQPGPDGLFGTPVSKLVCGVLYCRAVLVGASHPANVYLYGHDKTV